MRSRREHLPRPRLRGLVVRKNRVTRVAADSRFFFVVFVFRSGRRQHRETLDEANRSGRRRRCGTSRLVTTSSLLRGGKRPRLRRRLRLRLVLEREWLARPLQRGRDLRRERRDARLQRLRVGGRGVRHDPSRGFRTWRVDIDASENPGVHGLERARAPRRVHEWIRDAGARRERHRRSRVERLEGHALHPGPLAPGTPGASRRMRPSRNDDSSHAEKKFCVGCLIVHVIAFFGSSVATIVD